MCLSTHPAQVRFCSQLGSSDAFHWNIEAYMWYSVKFELATTPPPHVEYALCPPDMHISARNIYKYIDTPVSTYTMHRCDICMGGELGNRGDPQQCPRAHSGLLVRQPITSSHRQTHCGRLHAAVGLNTLALHTEATITAFERPPHVQPLALYAIEATVTLADTKVARSAERAIRIVGARTDQRRRRCNAMAEKSKDSSDKGGRYMYRHFEFLKTAP